MSRYIDTDVAIDKVDCLFRDTERDKCNFMLIGYNHAVADCIAILKNLDAVEVKHGHWIVIENDQNTDDRYKMQCSVCGGTLWSIEPEEWYCCKCGAKMDEVSG